MLKNLTNENKSKLNKNVMKVLIIRKGANGISVFILIFLFDNIIKNKLTIVPTQNATITAKTPDDNPSIQPIPSISLPSPNPIRRPFENNQMRMKGRAIAGPAIKLDKEGSIKV